MGVYRVGGVVWSVPGPGSCVNTDIHSHSFADSWMVNVPRLWATDKNAIIRLSAELVPSIGMSTRRVLGVSGVVGVGGFSTNDDMAILYIGIPLYIGEYGIRGARLPRETRLLRNDQRNAQRND